MEAMVKRPAINGVRFQVLGGRTEATEGVLCVSAYFLIFSSRKQSSQDEVTVLHTSIGQIENPKGTLSILLFLKDLRRFQLDFQNAEECKDTVETLERLSVPDRLDQLHAFHFRPSAKLKPEPCGWSSSSPAELMSRWKCGDTFRVTNINRKFKLCPSYPESTIVPASTTDEELLKVAVFRDSRRFPIICYHDHRTKAVLVRCGQPLCGYNQKKVKEDSNMLNACLPSRSRGKIIDIRSVGTASHHVGKGGGVETPAHYPQWKVEHAKFDPPSALQGSFNRLMEACSDPSLCSSSSWFGRLEGSGWLAHVSRLLEYAKRITNLLHADGCSVVVHGSASRDVTLQLTSLTQVLLDWRCRTMAGFVELIEREWLDGGHQFSLRHRPVAAAPEKEQAPIFLLFLDAVWQVMQQFPLSFQFNECFLHSLFVHSYSSQYGNFLFDTPKERAVHKLKDRTQSLWDFLAQPSSQRNVVNPIYDKNPGMLHITVTALNITLWTRLYLRTDAHESLQLPGSEEIWLLKERNTALHEKLKDVQKELADLQAVGRKYASNWS